MCATEETRCSVTSFVEVAGYRDSQKQSDMQQRQNNNRSNDDKATAILDIPIQEDTKVGKYTATCIRDIQSYLGMRLQVSGNEVNPEYKTGRRFFLW